MNKIQSHKGFSAKFGTKYTQMWEWFDCLKLVQQRTPLWPKFKKPDYEFSPFLCKSRILKLYKIRSLFLAIVNACVYHFSLRVRILGSYHTELSQISLYIQNIFIQLLYYENMLWLLSLKCKSKLFSNPHRLYGNWQ